MGKLICIIGSGPTGIAAAHALLARGASICLIDGGLRLEEKQRENLERVSRLDSAEWSQEEILSIKGEMKATSAGVSEKLAYGSNYPYRDTEHIYTPNKAIGVSPSLARGGFSNVWGGAMMPYLQEDTNEWAVKIDDLAEHYRAVIKLTGLAGQADALGERFPLYGEPHDFLPKSNHIGRFLADLKQSESELKKTGIWFGRSRLAIADSNAHGFRCAACKLCMYGCPYGLIFNSADFLPELQKNERFTYRTDIIVEKFGETAAGVEIYARERLSGKPVEFRADRLLVGAGVLSTARMVLESMEAFEDEIILKDSQYFLLPLLRFSATPEAEKEPQHTLSQAFLEIFDEKVSDKSIHLQIYGYNELYRQAIENKVRPFQKLTGSVTDAFLRRFILIQGYLHSDYSHAISIRLKKPLGANSQAKLELEVRHNPLTDKTLKKLVQKLVSARSLLRAVPLTPLLQKGTVGRGFHTGGTFPMRDQPQKFETDTLGRLPAWDKIHLIDASVFPSVPASTITLTAMANAHRIASQIDI